MEVQICGFNTFLGICQNWKVVESENSFWIGRTIVFAAYKKKQWVHFSDLKKEVFGSWDEFQSNYGIDKIEFLKGIYKKPKCDFCNSENIRTQPKGKSKNLCADCFNQF